MRNSLVRIRKKRKQSVIKNNHNNKKGSNYLHYNNSILNFIDSVNWKAQVEQHSLIFLAKSLTVIGNIIIDCSFLTFCLLYSIFCEND